MMGKGRDTTSVEDLPCGVKDMLPALLGIKGIPCLVSSPFREDRNPSFHLWSPDGDIVLWTDFATGEQGTLLDLLSKLLGCSPFQVPSRLREGIALPFPERKLRIRKSGKGDMSIGCHARPFNRNDDNYWESYGISRQWLKFADVHAIDRYCVSFDGKERWYRADPLSYAFVERKDGRVTMKIYQPLNREGRKWRNSHDASVISLWTKLPAAGDRLCVCSSLKDALCLWANAGIPSIALQGEGYPMKPSVASSLRKRFAKTYVCFDNDAPGLRYAEQFSRDTGFSNVTLPPFFGGKDVSDLYRTLGSKEEFCKITNELFNQ